MKNSRTKKILAVVLCVFAVITVLFSCKKENKKEQDIICIDPAPEFTYEGNYNGYEFCFLTQLPKDNENKIDYLVSDGENSEVISEAIYKRNEYLESRFNVKFAHKQVSDLVTTVSAQVNGGIANFDVTIADAESLAVLARKGLLLDLNSVDLLKMSKRWWDSNAAKQLAVGGKLYFTNCDLNIGEFGNVVYFNKEIINHLDLTSPYEYIKNNEWTLDKWANLVSEANGICVCGTVNIYGTLYENKNDLMFLQGSGVNPISHSDSGIFKVNEDKADKAKSVYEKIRGIFDSEHSWNMDNMDSADVHGYANKYDYARSLFCQDVFLFTYGGTNIISQFADMESEYGIVPFPKYDENQEDYYSLYPANANLIALPANLSGGALERTAVIVEGLNYYSNKMVKSSWYDNILQRRYVRDDESQFCLDLLYNNRIYDVGLYYRLYNSVIPTEQVYFSDAQFETIGSNLRKVVDGFNKKYYID